MKSLSRVPFFIRPRAAFRAAGEYRSCGVDAPMLRYAKFIFRDPPGEAFWKFTTGSNGGRAKMSIAIAASKKGLCRFSYRVDTLKGAAASRVCRHAFRFDSPSYRTLFRAATRSEGILGNYRIIRIHVRMQFACDIYLSRTP